MIQCRLCGCNFDETKVNLNSCQHCICGCGGNMVPCPNCGVDVRLSNSKKVNTNKETNGIINLLKQKLKI